MMLTVAVPAHMKDQANSLAMALGEGLSDGLTYGRLSARDASGNLFFWAVFLKSQLKQDWSHPLQRPAWDAQGALDIKAAEAARDALYIWPSSEDLAAPQQAQQDKISVIAGISSSIALKLLGLSREE